MKGYLDEVSRAGAGIAVKDILQRVRDKQLLCDLINEAGGMLQKGTLDVGLICSLLQQESVVTATLESVSARIAQGLPETPRGVAVNSLPILTAKTGGLYGVWAIAGEPGAGKSTLAWQVALDVAQGMKVLVYDFENGFAVAMDRTAQIFRGNHARIVERTHNLYHRDSIRTLDSDLGAVTPPALIIVDSVQKLPGSVEYRRTGLDKWIHRLEYLKKRGYHVLLISEVGRAHYDSVASIGAFKETGEIEYSADVGIQLIPAYDNASECHIVKNRHRPHKGYTSTLIRAGGWLFKEVGVAAESYDEVVD